MNNSARDVPGPGAAMMTVDCPQCQKQLRLLQPATIQTPISCCLCGATFYIQAVQTAPVSDAVVTPRGPAQRVGPAVGRPAPPLRLVTPPPPAPPVRLADREPVRRAADTPPATLSGPAPPVPTYAAPGMPRPVVLPEHVQRNFRTRWMESVLGSSLLVLLVVGASAGGFVLYRSYWGAATPARDTAPEPDTNAQPSAAGPGPAEPAPPEGVPLMTGKPLERTVRLVGGWDSRADDGSHSSFDFLADGTVVITPAGGRRPVKGKWFLVGQKGDDLDVEAGEDFGGAGNYRFTFRLTSPDAFTLVRAIYQGVVQPGAALRYVRVGPPRFEPSTGSGTPTP